MNTKMEIWAQVFNQATDVTGQGPLALICDSFGNLLVSAAYIDPSTGLPTAVYTPTTFYTVDATAAGVTAVWTPAGGKKFRLMGYQISVCGTLASTGIQTIKLLDSATVIKSHRAYVANPVLGDTQIGVDMGQGEVSSTPNNVLNVSLGTAMASGAVSVNVWGVEQ